LKSNHHASRYTFANEIVPSLQQTYNKIINVNEFGGVLNVVSKHICWRFEPKPTYWPYPRNGILHCV
jgi:hypothetical protein